MTSSHVCVSEEVAFVVELLMLDSSRSGPSRASLPDKITAEHHEMQWFFATSEAVDASTPFEVMDGWNPSKVVSRDAKIEGLEPSGLSSRQLYEANRAGPYALLHLSQACAL